MVFLGRQIQWPKIKCFFVDESFCHKLLLLLSKIERPVGFGGLCKKTHVSRDGDAADVTKVGRDLGIGAVIDAVIVGVEDGAAVTTTADGRRCCRLRQMRQRR